MLCKLAFRNVRKSIGDYTVYFVTLMFAVMFFYAFNSVDAQQAVMELNENKATAAQMMVESIGIFSTFVAITLAILILYANNFLIKRRNKELGIYLTLGMGKGRVAAIFMIETLIVGVIALAVGLLLGVLFSQVMSVITANMFVRRQRPSNPSFILAQSSCASWCSTPCGYPNRRLSLCFIRIRKMKRSSAGRQAFPSYWRSRASY